MDLLDVAGELYAGLPAEFTAARTAAEKRAKADGDAGLAGRLKALKKPSVGAWAVNLLVRHEADQIDQVLALAESLRTAAASLDGDELRALTRQRKQLTGALTTRARQLALENGVRLTSAVADLVEGTLNAALLDAGAADAVRTGMLVTTLASTGLDDADQAAAVAVPEAVGTRAAPAPSGGGLRVVPDNRDVQREAARDRVKAAEAEVATADRAVAKAGKAVEALHGRRMQLRAEIDELQRRIAGLEDDAEGLEDEIEVAEQDHEDAAGAAEEARSGLTQAQTSLADLDG